MELTTEKDVILQGGKDHTSAQDGMLSSVQVSNGPEDDNKENNGELEKTSLLRQSLREGLRRTFSAPTKLHSHIRIGRSRKKHSDKHSQVKPQEDSDNGGRTLRLNKNQTSINMDLLKVPTSNGWKLKKHRGEVGRAPKTFLTTIYKPHIQSQKRGTRQPLRTGHHILLIVIFAIIVLVIIIVSVIKVTNHSH